METAEEEQEQQHPLSEKEQEEHESALECAGTEKKKKTRRKKKSDKKNKKVVNGFEGKPYSHQPNALPDHPTLYDHHPRRMVYTQDELNRILPASRPKNLARFPWVVCAFLTPRTVIKQIEMFRFEQFVRRWPFVQAARFMYDALRYMGNRFGVSQQNIEHCFDHVLEIELENMLQFGAEHEFDLFIDTYKEELDREFREKYGFQPTSELFKIYDAFETEEKAEEFIENTKSYMGSKYMRLFKGDAREMLCFDPQDRDVSERKYINQECAQLMQQTSKNGKKRQDFFEKRMNGRIRNAYEENERIAAETGQTLTMKVDENGKIIESMKNKVYADLVNREAKPTAPSSAQLAASGAGRGGMVDVAQCIESTDLRTGAKKTEVVMAQDATYSKF